MGNKESQNDDFSRHANFNMNAHRQAMQHLGSNYAEANINLPINYGQRINVQQTEFKKINRSCSIYKPSFNIHVHNDTFTLEFQYDSQAQNRLEIYGGVVDIQEDPGSQITIRIQSKLFFQEQLAEGKKQKFKKQYPMSGYGGLQSATLIIRTISTIQKERSQYSLRKVRQPNEHWKVLLQKLQLNGIVTQLQNIYKGDESNQCIICLTEASNTLIQPCNHLCLCNECLKQVQKATNKCPICRNGIANFKVIINNS